MSRKKRNGTLPKLSDSFSGQEPRHPLLLGDTFLFLGLIHWDCQGPSSTG